MAKGNQKFQSKNKYAAVELARFQRQCDRHFEKQRKSDVRVKPYSVVEFKESLPCQ